MSEFRDAMREFREHQFGVVSCNRNPTDHSTDNGLLFSATYICLIDQPELEKEWFDKLLKACQVAPGLFNRYPGDDGKDSWDDLIGVAAASHLLGLPYDLDILSWGESHKWSWNNQNPLIWTGETFLGRFPAFIAFLQGSAGKAISPADQFLFSAACIASPFGTDTSGKCLMYLMTRTIYGRHFMTDLAIDIWRILMKRKYPGGMRDVYRVYFTDPMHPFHRFGPTDFK